MDDTDNIWQKCRNEAISMHTLKSYLIEKQQTMLKSSTSNIFKYFYFGWLFDILNVTLQELLPIHIPLLPVT